MNNKVWKSEAHRLEGKVRNLGIKPKKKAKKKILVLDPLSPLDTEFMRDI